MGRRMRDGAAAPRVDLERRPFEQADSLWWQRCGRGGRIRPIGVRIASGLEAVIDQGSTY